MTSATRHLRPQDTTPLDMGEFAGTAGLSESDIRELIDYGLLARDRLDTRTALVLREAARLQKDFDLDLFTTGLLAGYLLRIDTLESELGRLRAERPARAVYTEVSFTSVTRTR
ncbi:MAG TPA: hypothetical protein VFM98_19130 [Ramlibacter sp.]|uniref:hypothetical protein n=1 Tax=Ramlibacter sp. TaxID=1917967 RepID=UPI002D801187|nr:hypothetical protein [Ramlibacter sp.]HET8747721.1 hypothetical protein [Ramlibacter sp.]